MALQFGKSVKIAPGISVARESKGAPMVRFLALMLLFSSSVLCSDVQVVRSEDRVHGSVGLDFILDGIIKNNLGEYVIMGTVKNSSDMDYDSTTMRLTLKDAEGKFITRITASPQPNAIGSGEVSYVDERYVSDQPPARIEYVVLGSQDQTKKQREREEADQINSVLVLLKQYMTAQVTFQVGRQGRNDKTTSSGPLGYADNYRNLYYGTAVGQPQTNLQLVSKAMADASITGNPITPTVSSVEEPLDDFVPYAGYVFLDDPHVDWGTDYGLFGLPYPLESGRPVFWAGSHLQGVIYYMEPPIDLRDVTSPLKEIGKWKEWGK